MEPVYMNNILLVMRDLYLQPYLNRLHNVELQNMESHNRETQSLELQRIMSQNNELQEYVIAILNNLELLKDQ